MGVSAIVILCLIGSLSSIVSAGLTRPLSQAEKCNLLDNALGQFLAKRQEPDTLYMVFGYYMYPDDRDLVPLARSAKLDFLKSATQRHQLACKLVGARSREDIRKILGVQRSVVNNYYDAMKHPILDIGSVKKMDEVSKVLTLLFIWAQNTGYPTLPLRNLDERKTLEIFGAIKKAMMSKHVHDYLIDAPFPLKVSPQRAYRFLKESRAYQQLERGVFMTPGSLTEFADLIKITPGGVQARKENVQATMQFVNALDKTGVLNLT